jgi:hypothetical protein
MRFDGFIQDLKIGVIIRTDKQRYGKVWCDS